MPPSPLARRVLAVALSCSLPAALHAQDTTVAPAVARLFPVAAPGHLQLVTLRDGSKLVGRITAADTDVVHFASSAVATDIAVSKIRSVSDIEGELHDGEYWPPNSNTTRLLFAPTARTLKRGEGYFSDYYIFLPGFAAGVTDWLSVGGGMSIAPGAGIDQQLYFFTPKVRLVEHDKFSAATGALIAHLGSGGNSFGVLYGVGPYGTANASVTGGLGYGFLGGSVIGKPVVMLGGEQRLTKHIGFVTENYFISGGSTHVLSGGVRFIGSKLTTDLALFRPVGYGSGSVGLGIPWVDFVFHP